MARGLVVNRFAGAGIWLQTNGGNAVEGNFVGTDATGTIARPNGNAGIFITSGGNVIGGATPAARNLVSGNTSVGILISGAAASNNRVEGNFVGTTITGLAALPNTVAGVQVLGGSGNVIGGNTPAQRNLISGGGNNGVSLRSGALNNLVQGNYIGVDVTGTAALPNSLRRGVHR